jgi:hypothetical protein
MLNNTSSNIDTITHSMINVNGQNCTMIIHDNFITLSSDKTFTSSRVEYIVTTFNANKRKASHIIKIYKTFNIILVGVHIRFQKFLDLMQISCPTIIIDDFNTNMLGQNSTQQNEFQNFMDQYSMELQFF